jgi:hypothetical protein
VFGLEKIFKPVKKEIDTKLQRKVNEPAYAQQESDMRATYTDPSADGYKGPAWDVTRASNGQPVLQQSTDPNRLMEQADFEAGRGKYAAQPENTGPQTDGVEIPDAARQAFEQPVTNPTLTTAERNDRLAQAINSTRAFSPGAAFGALPQRALTVDRGAASTPNNPYLQFDPTGLGKGGEALQGANEVLKNGGGGGGAGSPAPDINREHIDKLLGGLDTYANDIYALSKDNTGQSLAQAQLDKSQAEAKIRAATQLQANQSGALGQARSSRSRNDRALLERAAVGEQAYLGQEAQRQDVQRQAEFEGNQAVLRATEEDADRRFRLDALSKASDLGLNTAALETDISKANLQSATDWVNNEFQQMGIDKQINSQEAQSILGYTRDMAAIQFQYDQLSEQEKQAADQMIMQKYGIDQQTAVALKGIKEQGKFHWDQMLGGILGGVGSAATGGLATVLGGGKKGP